MKKQTSINQSKAIPLLNSQLLERYNSLPRLENKRSYESELENFSSFKSQKSFHSKSDAGRKMYVSKSPLFFKKLYESAKKQEGRQDKLNGEAECAAKKRMIDINFVLEQSKKRFQAKINPRLMERNDPIMRLSTYDNFSPFKRNHQILRKIDKVGPLNPEPSNDANNYQRQ